MKLTSTDYMSLQVHALLDGYDLAGHIDGTTPAPDETITLDANTTVNPDFTKWRRQDCLIYSAILGTLSPPIQALVTSSKSSRDVWQSLSATYATPSRGHIQQLWLQLKHFTKGDKSIDEYMRGLTTRFDQLRLLGKPLDHEDKIEYIIDGLPEEYKSVTEKVEGCDTTPSIIEIHEKLINKEAKLLTVSVALSSSLPMTANVASTRPKQHQSQNTRGNNSNWNTNYRLHNNFSPQNQDSRSKNDYQGKCQICSVFGHSALRCPQMSQHYNKNGTSPFRLWQPQANMDVAA